jgi:hypothetical protein
VSVFTADGIYIVASKKKVEFLKPAENVKESDCPFVKLITREKVCLIFLFKKKKKYVKIKFTNIDLSNI